MWPSGTSESGSTDRGMTAESDSVDPWSVTIEPLDLEKKYRAATAQSHSFQIIVGLTVLSMPLIGFAYSDYLLFGMGPRLWLLLALRAVVVVGAAVAIRFVRTDPDAQRIDRGLLAWWLAFAACITTIDSTRPAGYVLHVAMDVLCVLTAYVLPMRWTHQLVAGAVLTIGPAMVFFTLEPPLEPMQLALVVVSFTYANTLGVFLSRHLHIRARSEFVARIYAQRARSTLRALSLFVPMCAGCKSIKDNAGHWHRVEEYVHAETGQSVTHGLCPTCMRQLYPELAERILASNEAAQDERANRA